MTTLWYPLALAAIGLFLSAFFSGSETGFYRATRLRLMLDALGGDWIARGLLWLTNRPSLFVATTLVGNNLANYMTSLAIVMGTHVLLGDIPIAELIAPLVLAPVLFVYGELMPKDLFLQAPNRLLRRGGPLFMICFILFFPVSVALWGLSKVLERLVGQAPEQIRLTLARRELRRFLEEGHAAGILHRSQRGLAQGIFAVANRPVSQFATPLDHLPRARSDMTKQEVLRLARSYRLATVPVESADSPGELIGCVRVIDLGLSESDTVAPLRGLLEVAAETPQVDALMQMESEDADLACVTDEEGKATGVITAAGLREPLFRGGR